MVRWFIQNQKVGGGEEHLCQKCSFALTARKLLKLLIEICYSKFAGDLLHFSVILPGLKFFHQLQHVLHLFRSSVRIMNARFVLFYYSSNFVFLIKQNIIDCEMIWCMRCL